MNPVVHWELYGKDATRLASFYSELFGWKLRPLPEIGYVLIDTQAGTGICGGIATSGDASRLTTFYIEVDDIQPVLERIEKAGGKTTLAPVNEIVTFAQFADPEQNIVEAAQER
ncbi:MAG: VOC family protein [Nocardioidaceae bacterium]|nr:VOC family protein [Nocardioidaceae bacterium]